MSAPAPDTPESGRPRSRARTYAAVILLEAVVVAALWLFGRYFSG